MLNIFAAYKGNHLGKEKTLPVTQEEIDDEISRLLNEHNHGKKKEGASENGDIVNIDFEGFLDGVAFEGGKGEHYDLELGSHSFIPGFEEQLVNHLAGDEVDVKTTFPTNYHAKDLAGKEVIFKCKIHEVKTKSNPEFNDEFATHIGYKSKEELLKAIEDNLKANHESDAKNSYLEKLLHHIVSTSSIELTHDQIEKGKKQIIEYYNSTLSHYGLTIDTYLQTIGKSHSEFDAMIIKEAENTATTELLAKYIGEKENLLPTDDEINYRVQMYKVAYHIPDDKIDEFLAIQKEEIATEVLKEKVAKFLLENND